MRNLLQKCFKWQWLVCIAVGCCFASCKDDEESTSGYDPNKPIVLTDFYPNEGKLATQVILNGSNFGNSKENVKVFFNDKEASVISVKDDRMLVLAPKRASTVEDPECVVKVQVQEQMGEYNQTFNYYIQTTVTTLVGGSTSAQVNPTGTIPLSEAQFRANIDRCICVDKDKNVFFLVDNDGKFAAFMLNEEADKLISLKSDINAMFNSPILGYNSKEGIVYQFWANRDSHDVNYFDPKTDYAPTTAIGSVSWDDSNFPNIEGFGVWAAKCNFTMGPDGKMYSRMLGGNLVRIDVENARGENLTNGDLVGTKDGSAYGLVFDPQDENVFYFSNNDKHCIYKYDLRTKEWACWAGQEGKSGYLDGPIGQAMFNKPGQMCVDSEGNIILTDTENHCIRKITMSTGYVSTLAGKPQNSGYVNGSAEDAQFKKPLGICIDNDDVMYIGDSENRAIRRLAVE
ncbi:IPT/TIG domain-containing protein [Bacteroides faecis]|uniref:IPT/TIG domain-containing protein n=1 Tax=Bacteroides faecis TaxID=674529 RepID=UPI001021C437|nr:IPT/TIG domain-containing protein [Bacteroides faecis]KAA5272094.1 hypothetical protein F2Z41_02195 [Bacteroides faecis]RYT93146.1 hypothetical protein EAJ04_00985 [Bacteroides faecis]